MIECLKCHGQVSKGDTFITCVSCNYPYHVGDCSGLSMSKFRKQKDSVKAAWNCATCLTASNRGASVPSESNASNIEQKLIELNDKFSMLIPLVAKVDALSELITKVTGIESSIAHLSDLHDKIMEKLDKQENDIASLKKRVERIESGTSPVVAQMKRQLNDLEQYSRRQNIEIHGIERTENENLLEKMKDLARTLELPEITSSDVDALHRLPARAGKESVVIARFHLTTLKKAWLESRSALKLKKPDMRIFDNLTASNKHLLWLARMKAEEKCYRFVWQKNGHVLVRKDEGDAVIRIHDERDLEKLV